MSGRFRVEWVESAEDQLIDIWVASSNQGAVTKAQAEIDRCLADAPDRHGRHLSEGLYVIRIPPLAACYSIDFARALVEVANVYLLRV